MARITLIALLTLVAVAWPVGAQGSPQPALGLEAPVAVESDDGSVSVTVWVPDPSLPACMLLGCNHVSQLAASQAASCRATYMVWEPSEGILPDLSVTVDPDGCVRRVIDEVWPLWESPAFLLPDSLDFS